MTDKKLQDIVVQSRKSWGFAEEDHMLLICGLTAEVGELATAVRAQYVYNKPAVPEDDKSSLKHEMADVLIYLYALAEKCGVDLDSAVLSKLEINNKRFKK